MNYKNIIRSRRLRLIILQMLSWVPDSIMIRLQYWLHNGRFLNINNPKRFTEKIQWYKLYYRNPILWRCVDKYEVREYLREKGYSHYLNELYCIENNIENIDFTHLPERYVVKATSGGGSNWVYVCKNNNAESQSEILKRFKGVGGQTNKLNPGREWAYEKMPPNRIMVEEFIYPEKGQDCLTDYKFYCFGGKPMYCQVIADRTTKETIDFYDMDWNHMHFYGLNPECKQSVQTRHKPKGYDEMIKLASELSQDFPFVRVDLYNVDGRIYFGELTFYPASGYGAFTPDNIDFEIGDLFVLPSKNI